MRCASDGDGRRCDACAAVCAEACGGAAIASLLACLRRWWRWWRWCESERVLSVPEGMAAALAAVLLPGKARSDMLLSGCLLGMHCLLACVAACALLWPAGWLAGCSAASGYACVRMRPADAILRSARGGATRRRMRYDAVLATHGARMACGWRHGAALAWRLHAHALTRAARWVDVADWRCCMATRRRRSALACGDACHHHHRCRRHHHYHDDDVNNDDDDAGGER